jgi:hypothetical protein
MDNHKIQSNEKLRSAGRKISMINMMSRANIVFDQSNVRYNTSILNQKYVILIIDVNETMNN